MNRRRMPFFAWLAIAGMALVGSASAAATAVYRCGNAYSEHPCADGRAIDATDARSAAQQRDALRLAAEERHRTVLLERDRLARESLAPKAAARLDRPVVVASHRPKVASGHKPNRRVRSGQIDADDFVAFDSSARRKTRRID